MKIVRNNKGYILLKRDVVAQFKNLPVSMLFKCEGDAKVYASRTFIHLWGDNFETDVSLSSLVFFDPVTKLRLEGDACPIHIAEKGGHFSQWAQLQIASRSTQCFLESSVLQMAGKRWVLIAVKTVQSTLVLGGDDMAPVSRHITFNRLMAKFASQLINTTKDKKDRIFDECLAAYGSFCNVDRCYLFELSEGRQFASNTHEWVAAGVSPHKDELQDMPISGLPYLRRILTQKGVFQIDDVALMPKEGCAEKEEFEREKIRSVLIVALKNGDDIFGFVGCDIIGSPYYWQEQDISYLKRIGAMLANTLNHIHNKQQLESTQGKLIKANEKLKKLAHIDGLTHIANRRLFDETLTRDCARHWKNSTSLSLLLLDVDFFKLFNDEYGHVCGDNALKAVAKVLEASCIGNEDLVARYGGEEFAVILPGATHAIAHQVAQRIQSNIHARQITFTSAPHNQRLSVSIGVASLESPNKLTPVRLIKRADSALYLAKSAGRNCIRFWHDMPQSSSSNPPQ
ncbi:diguanylate cyclase [Alteromonas sp. 345S023]|uniref:diguanylate cyclase n=1 Tax=Alteromonas profundi TaxID=2696062 RepID=A0A7X5LKM8_9ALTE|nr:diguanylate cyclase [Alteromonas profundi]NDV90739.1 diguanylate cyclase [Alteromonas profundi]